MLRALLLMLCLFTCLPSANAQQEMEVISLRSRTVEQVLPIIQPLVEPGGALTGMNNQLFLRASKRNREDIKRALAALDIPARQLIIRVSSTRGSDDSSRGGAISSGRVVIGSNSRVEGNGRVWDTTSQRNESNSQMVRAMEGSQAYINAGRSVPVPMRQVVMGPGGVVVSETVVYRDIGSGFYAIPRLSGDMVTLEIMQQADSPGNFGPGSANTQRISTTVSGRLGEWIELGGVGRQAMGNERGTTSISTSDLRENRSIWLKVEEAQ